MFGLRNRTIATAIAAAMMIVALGNLFALNLDIRTLSSVCFAFSSMMLMLMVMPRTAFTQSLISMGSFSLLFSVALTVVAAILAQPYSHTPDDIMIYLDIEGVPHASSQHYPSFGSVLGFTFMSAASFVYLFNTDRMYRRVKLFGVCIFAVGMGPFIHWITGLPHTNYAVTWWYSGNGMGITTATLFVAYGIGLRFASKACFNIDHAK